MHIEHLRVSGILLCKAKALVESLHLRFGIVVSSGSLSGWMGNRLASVLMCAMYGCCDGSVTFEPWTKNLSFQLAIGYSLPATSGHMDLPT